LDDVAGPCPADEKCRRCELRTWLNKASGGGGDGYPDHDKTFSNISQFECLI
jgi:hypothetical protein